MTNTFETWFRTVLSDTTSRRAISAFVSPRASLGIGVVFTAFAVATTASAVAAVPALLRGRLVGWAVAVLWLSCFVYWSVYKVFAQAESESVGFLAVAVGTLALLATRSARSFAGVHG